MAERAGDVANETADVLAAYDLTPPVAVFALANAGGINNRVRGVRTGAGTFVLKTYLARRDPPALRYEHRLLAWLSGERLSFRTPHVIPTRTGDTLCPTSDGTGWHALFTYLTGDRLDWNNPALIEELGAALAELHGVLARYPRNPAPGLVEYADLEHIHPAVPAPDALTLADFGLPSTPESRDILRRWRAMLDATRAFIAGPYRALSRQIIHGDFGPGNAFADGGRVVAIFDFEFAMPAARAIEAASGLTFVMRLWERGDDAALAMAHRFCHGYARCGGLTDAEIAALPRLMLLRDVVSVIWWTGRNRENGTPMPADRVTDADALTRWLTRNEAVFFAAVR